jgi:CRP/FNR family cyclic AMP-dependent transcriptional regulator
MTRESAERFEPRLEAMPRPMVPAPLALDAAALGRFLDHCHRRRYPARSEVFRPGDDGSTLYYVVAGSLAVVTEDENGRELILSYINQGDFIGEMGLFVEPQRREVVTRCRAACELAEISYERLWQVLDGPLKADCAKILFAVGAQLTRRLLQTNRKVSRLAFLDVTGRVARQLLDLTQEPEAVVHPKGMQVRVSRQELSRLVGCSREMVGRVLKQLHEAGKLVVRGKTIVVIGATRRA